MITIKKNVSFLISDHRLPTSDLRPLTSGFRPLAFSGGLTHTVAHGAVGPISRTRRMLCVNTSPPNVAFLS